MNFGSAIISSDNIISEDVLLCLRTLYSITEGTQPLARGLGIDPDLVSKPMDVAMNEYSLDIVEKTELYEPRVKVREVTFKITENGLIPTIHLVPSDMKEGEEDEQ